MEVNNQAHFYQYRQYGAVGYQVLVSEDERTCDTCSDLDGTTFDINDDDGLRPPFHNYCRCTIIPVLGALPDDAGQVSQDTSDTVTDWRDTYFDIPDYSAEA